MGDEFDLFFRVFDSLGTFGIMSLVVFAMFKGWVIPVATINKIDIERKEHLKEINTAHTEVTSLLQSRIKDLERLAEERRVRVEQGVQLLSMFVEAQDTLSKVADNLQLGGHGGGGQDE